MHEVNEYTQKLFSAVTNPYISPQKVHYLIQKGGEIDACKEDGTTVLMTALCHVRNEKVIEELLKAGANINTQNKHGANAILIAAMNNSNPKIISQLIIAGADVHSRDEYGNSILMKASECNNNPFVIIELIKAGAEVNAVNQYRQTALMMAAKNLNSDNARILVRAGADIESRDKFGQTAISYAYDTESDEPLNETLQFFRWVNNALFEVDWENITPEEVRRLIWEGANVNACSHNRTTPLYEAAAKSHNPNIFEALISAGANDIDDALVMAASSNNYEAVSVLLMYGADPNDCGPVIGTGMSALMYAAGNHSSPEIISLLIENGADVNSWGCEEDDYGEMTSIMTPLMFAVTSDVYKYNIRVIDTLIALGADVNAKDNDGRSVLMWASLKRIDTDTVAALIRAGADVNAKDDFGKTALIWAVSQTEEETDCDIDSINLLIRYGADINAKDMWNCTALMYAADNEVAVEVIDILISAGADMYAKDRSGCTALDYAKGNSNSELIKTLEELQ